ncbi:hypothetical protein FACS1894176_06870 [Bacteroidia bacterium]|nr:hypothetical protein FACS1894176_06870 [Bacteroidia bacterium]
MSPFVTSLENLELSDLQVPIDDTQLDIQKIGELSSEQIQKAI